MEKVIREDSDERVIRSFRMECEWLDDNGNVIERNCGFLFDCDENGNLNPNIADRGKENFAQCLTGINNGQKVSIPRLMHFDRSIRLCPCGSHQIPSRRYDGHGIYLCTVCSKCEQEKMARYRSDIMEWYESDEPIEAQ